MTKTIEPVFVRRIKLETDPLLPNEWNISNTGQYDGTVGADMKVSNVWNMGYTGTGVKVAVIDLGVDLNHPDLQPNLLAGYDATGNNSAGAPVYDAYNTHGTNCAGIIAEVQNNIGGAGVAYNAKIIPIRFGYVDPPNINPNGYITTSDTWESNCFNFAVNNGADIISNSWGGGSPSSQLDAAILNATTNGRGGKGAIVLFSAGNNNNSVSYPAYNPNVIAVGASSMCDTRKRSSNNPSLVNPGVTPDPLDVSCDNEYWWGSNYGTNLDIMAPGVKIATTTLPTGSDYSNAYISNFNGTSAACPNTAAVAALILSANLNLTGQQVRNILESSADKVGGYSYQSNISGQPNGAWSSDAGYGRVDACASVTKALLTALQIAGPPSLCSSQVYEVPNLPSGATVIWSTTGSISISGANNVNPVTVYQTADGNGTLTANITASCGNYSINKEIRAGVPVFISQSQGPGVLCPGDYAEFNVTANGAYSYNWTYDTNTLEPGTSPTGDGPQLILKAKPNYDGGFVRVDISNECGDAQVYGFWTLGLYCSGGFYAYSVYPNPAGSELIIDYRNKDQAHTSQAMKAEKNFSVRLLNAQGKILRTGISRNNEIKLDTRNIENGNYFLHIKDSGQTIKKQIIIKH